jgi:hypothetical protein
MTETRKLDQAWAAINALGGTPTPGDAESSGFVYGIDKALEVIEELGGMDPLKRKADILQVNMTAEQAARIMKAPVCPTCGLKAASLEHRFCTHQDCPVLAAIATLKQRTAENAE